MNLVKARQITRLGCWRAAPGQFDISQRRLARYYNSHPRALKARIETPRTTHFWGKDYTITPQLLSEPLGDGMTLACLVPLNTRPDYYVASIDSRWLTDTESDDWYDVGLEQLMEALEDEFGRYDYHCYDCGAEGYDDTECECQQDRDFPAVNLNAGCSWGTMYWPQ